MPPLLVEHDNPLLVGFEGEHKHVLPGPIHEQAVFGELSIQLKTPPELQSFMIIKPMIDAKIKVAKFI